MSDSLKHKTAHGIFWSVIERFSAQGIGLVLGIFIARILSPEDFGVIAVTQVFFAVFSAFIDSGFSSALIRKTDRTESDMATVFYYNTAVGGAAFAIFFALAGYVAAFFEMPQLKSIIRILSVTLIINSLGAVQQALLVSSINFKKLAWISLGTVSVSGLLGFWFAWRGFGVWALVVQMGSASVIRTLLLTVTVGWRPRRPFSSKSFHELFGFGSKLLASSLIDILYKNIFPMLIGKFYNAASLGIYSRADQYSQFPSSNITGIIQRVSFPVLCTIQDEDVRLKMSYRKLIRTSAFVVFPLMAGLAALAKPMILIMLTDKWEGVIVLLQILCAAMMWYPIHAINLNLLQVKGRSDLFLKLEIVKKCLGVGILLATLPLGLTAFCWGRVATSLISLAINTHYTGKLINVGFLEQMKDILPSLAISAVMGAAVWSVSCLPGSNLLALVAGVVIGATIYLGAARLLRLRELGFLVEMIKSIKV